jgi:hypothetical protein
MPVETPYTVRSIAEEARDILHSYTRGQEQRTSLAMPITDDDLTFQVSGELLISRGLVEIGDELVYVASVDATTGVAVVEPWGRAQSGSTAASHATGAEVTMSPLYPRHRLAGVAANVLREVFPGLFAVEQTELDINPAKTNYELPADAYQVLSVEWNWPGPSGMWAPVERWRQNKPTTGLELEVISATWPGQNRVRAKYGKAPKSTWDIDDDLGDYGYDHEIRDVIVLGVVARSLAYTAPSRLQVESVESHARSEAVPPTAITDASRYMFALFRQRLEEERQQILLRHPIQPHRTR